MKLLLINQNPVVSKLVGLSAQKANVEASEVESAEGLPEGDDYDLVIVDDAMASDELVQALKERFSSCAKVLIHAGNGVKMKGFDHYLRKPFLPTEMVDLLGTIKEELEHFPAMQGAREEDEAIAGLHTDETDDTALTPLSETPEKSEDFDDFDALMDQLVQEEAPGEKSAKASGEEAVSKKESGAEDEEEFDIDQLLSELEEGSEEGEQADDTEPEPSNPEPDLAETSLKEEPEPEPLEDVDLDTLDELEAMLGTLEEEVEDESMIQKALASETEDVLADEADETTASEENSVAQTPSEGDMTLDELGDLEALLASETEESQSVKDAEEAAADDEVFGGSVLEEDQINEVKELLEAEEALTQEASESETLEPAVSEPEVTEEDAVADEAADESDNESAIVAPDLEVPEEAPEPEPEIAQKEDVAHMGDREIVGLVQRQLQEDTPLAGGEPDGDEFGDLDEAGLMEALGELPGTDGKAPVSAPVQANVPTDTPEGAVLLEALLKQGDVDAIRKILSGATVNIQVTFPAQGENA